MSGFCFCLSFLFIHCEIFCWKDKYNYDQIATYGKYLS